MNKKIAIVGAGGHGKVVGEIALLNQYKIVNFFDDKENEIKEFPFIISGTLNYLKQNLKDVHPEEKAKKGKRIQPIRTYLPGQIPDRIWTGHLSRSRSFWQICMLGSRTHALARFRSDSASLSGKAQKTH